MRELRCITKQKDDNEKVIQLPKKESVNIKEEDSVQMNPNQFVLSINSVEPNDNKTKTIGLILTLVPIACLLYTAHWIFG